MKNIFPIICYIVCVVLIAVGMWCPPPGIVDSSVLIAVGILIGGYQVFIGNSVKEFHIDRTGLHITMTEECHDKQTYDHMKPL